MNAMKKNLKLIKNNKTKCPTCGSFSVKSSYPFCSQRCSSIDLGKWFNENYRIQTQEKLKVIDSDRMETDEGDKF